VDELDVLMQRFKSEANEPASSRLDILLDIRRRQDARIVPFLLQVLMDSDESSEVRVEVVKELRNVQLAATARATVARSIGKVLLEERDARLRLQAAMALGCFADVQGIPSTLGEVALDTVESLELRYSALTSMERADATGESIPIVRKLTADEALGPAARSLLATWRLE